MAQLLGKYGGVLQFGTPRDVVDTRVEDATEVIGGVWGRGLHRNVSPVERWAGGGYEKPASGGGLSVTLRA